jgi:CHASE1-domain containing sensor protein
MKKDKIVNNYVVSIVALLIGIVLTIFVSYTTKKDIEKQNHLKFSILCKEIKTSIVSRLYSHAQLLQNSSSFITSSDNISRKDWALFVENTKIGQNLPGFQGIGYNVIVPKNQLEQHVLKMNTEYKDYNIRPSNDRDFYTSIIFLEPLNDRNKRAIGYDTYSEPIRREAMKKAANTNCFSLTRKLMLVQENGVDLQSGIIMYSPVYKRNLPVSTIDERQKAIIGWVSSPYRMDDLMENILGSWDKYSNHKMHLQIYDNDSIVDNAILFDSQKNNAIIQDNLPSDTIQLPMNFAGNRWTLYFMQYNVNKSHFSNKVFILFFSGVLISFLLSLLTFALISTKRRANIIAAKLTSEISLQNKELKRNLLQ